MTGDLETDLVTDVVTMISFIVVLAVALWGDVQ